MPALRIASVRVHCAASEWRSSDHCVRHQPSSGSVDWPAVLHPVSLRCGIDSAHTAEPPAGRIASSRPEQAASSVAPDASTESMHSCSCSQPRCYAQPAPLKPVVSPLLPWGAGMVYLWWASRGALLLHPATSCACQPVFGGGGACLACLDQLVGRHQSALQQHQCCSNAAVGQYLMPSIPSHRCAGTSSPLRPLHRSIWEWPAARMSSSSKWWRPSSLLPMVVNGEPGVAAAVGVHAVAVIPV